MAVKFCGHEWDTCFTKNGVEYPHICLQYVDTDNRKAHQVHRCEECQASKKTGYK